MNPDPEPQRDVKLDPELDALRNWIGRTEQRTDDAMAAPLAALSATLDRDDPLPGPGSDVPPLGHWLYFLPVAPRREIGADGHPRRGGFLPPVPLPRRMWAGGRFRFHHPLHVGDAIARTSRIEDVTVKHGRSGALVFVTVRHDITNASGIALTESHDIVYRDNPRPGAPAPTPQTAPADSHFSRRIVPDPVLLFRYSALTFNGHRIHYDRSYVTGVEGYPGLIVHGPLVATLLLDLLRRTMPDAVIETFAFRAVKPLFDIAPFSVHGQVEPDGKTVKLWASDADGWLAMDASATIA
ncbi:MAG: MaoC family dehydratase N-terminal domain-containing protein [Pseudomonadota bacterium]|nr:MaoC family dehydratase N-terminal domain-containing protein [Pseudomonadota bacterium]